MAGESINPIERHMREQVQTRLQKLIADENAILKVLADNPDLPIFEREANKREATRLGQQFESTFDKILPLIKRLRGRIPRITDQTNLTAVYLLLGKVSNTWRAVFSLVKEGCHQEVIELLRSINENLDLVSLFLIEGDNGPSLRKWFDGAIIKNAKARDAIDRFFDEKRGELGLKSIPFKKAKDAVYGGLSKYSHGSYAALLDSVNVYDRDFDFDKVAGFHYTLHSSIPFIQTMLTTTIVELKHIYTELNEPEMFGALDALYKEINPQLSEKRLNTLIDSMVARFNSDSIPGKNATEEFVGS